jgi:hypothetical protein
MQYIVNKATAIEVSRAKTVGQLVVRSGRIRTAERASLVPWNMIVSPPTYTKFEDVRDVIEGITLTDRNRFFYIGFNSNPGLNYITEYQGDLNTTQLDALRVSTSTGYLGFATFDVGDALNIAAGSATTATFDYMRLTNLPAIGATIGTDTVATITAETIASTGTTYARAFSTARTDFLVKTSTYDSYGGVITTGLTVTVPTFVTGGQTISTITRNYLTVGNVSYTRIIMSAVANANSTAATVDGGNTVSTSLTRTRTVTSSTVIFAAGDWVQFKTDTAGNLARGAARTVPLDVLRGTGTTVDVPVHRPWIFDGNGSYSNNERDGAALYIGNDVMIAFVLTRLPSWKLLPGKLVQWTGDFELFEYIGG